MWGVSLSTVEIFNYSGPCSNPRAQIGVQFCTAKRTHVPVVCAKFHVNQCNESIMRGENADLRSLSKFNTGSLPFAASC